MASAVVSEAATAATEVFTASAATSAAPAARIIRSTDLAAATPDMRFMPDSPQSIEIPGIDANYGLSLYAGMMETYLPILRSFAENMPAIVDKLRVVTEASLPDYAIKVHGLKGASAGIGAESISKRALGLEMMAKAGDLQSILALNREFTNDVETLIGEIRIWFDFYSRKLNKPRLSAPDPVLLAELRQSLKDYDMGGIDNAMEQLRNADYEKNNGLVEWLEERITESDFFEAAQCITNVLDVLEINVTGMSQ